MPRVNQRLLALCLALVLASGGVISVSPVGTASAVDAPWTLPFVPPKCTTAQADSGDVASCMITVPVGLPESRGWPTPPFPQAGTGGVLPWVDLARGASGPIVTKVQQALIATGATIVADGQFGPATETAVKTFQTAHSLPATGIVDTATAAALGVQNTSTGTFPGPGWNWLGWAYNGSPVLANWEAQLATNTTAIGSVRPGVLRAFPDALRLFEGFLAEIQAKGYVLRDEGIYAFRCTASTTKDCRGLTRSSLSNHAYGLATDFNTAQNPMRTYYSVGGKSACQTPIVTDIPKWVVDVGQKWGLYWGGWGWSAGCTSPSQVKSSASRDPMHFEFNGTVTQARAILAHNAPDSCFDTIDTAGAIAPQCFGQGEVPPANTRVVVTTNAPAGATAAMVNITATGASSTGYFVAEACVAAPNGVRPYSNGNVRPGRAVAASAIVAIDAQGRFCLYQSAAMHTIVDVQGFFAPAAVAPTGNLFAPVVPQRTTDTRNQTYCTPSSGCFNPGRIAPGVEIVNTAEAPAGAVATVANITAYSPTSGGYLTADACATLVPGPQNRSNVNFGAGDTVANLGVVPTVVTAQGAQFCTYSPSGLHEIIDVQGFFVPAGSTAAWVDVAQGASGAIVTSIQQALNNSGASLVADGQFGQLTFNAVKAFQTARSLPSTGVVDTATAIALGLVASGTPGPGLGFTQSTPSRLVDTRQCWTDPITSVERCNQINAAGSLVRVRAPQGASMVVVNLTAINAAGGYVSAGACSAFGSTPPKTSNLNAVVGAAVANEAVVAVDPDGTFCAYVSASMHLAIDVMGTYSADGTQRFLPVTPVRVHDSRPGA